MRILVPLDENPYSIKVLHEVARLAMNTWADVTLLGIDTNRTKEKSRELVNMLRNYREEFLDYFSGEISPYSTKDFGYKLVEIKSGIWEDLYVAKSGRKELKVRIRNAPPVKAILAEAQEEESDLIVIGCDKTRGCEWVEYPDTPYKVAEEAFCSVIVVKDEKKSPSKIICCLDHDNVSQASLEMINQMVTLYKAELEIVGITAANRLKEEVDRKMNEILRYYTNQRLKAWVTLVDASSMGSFITEAAEQGLLALWMGKKSLFEKILPKHRVGNLIKASACSVLILR